MLTKLFLLRVMFHVWLARKVPVMYADIIDDMAHDLIKLAGNYRESRSKNIVDPFLGTVKCENMNCGFRDVVVSLGGVDPSADLVCASCGELSAGIA